MATLIVYASRQGCARKVAESVAVELGSGVRTVDLALADDVDPDAYDTVVVGGSIYYGRIQRSVARFCERHRQQLLEKRLGLYLCCLLAEQAEQEFEQAFPEQLRRHATASAIFSGGIVPARLNPLERLIVKLMAGRTTQQPPQKERLQAFTAALKGEVLHDG